MCANSVKSNPGPMPPRQSKEALAEGGQCRGLGRAGERWDKDRLGWGASEPRKGVGLASST